MITVSPFSSSAGVCCFITTLTLLLLTFQVIEKATCFSPSKTVLLYHEYNTPYKASARTTSTTTLPTTTSPRTTTFTSTTTATSSRLFSSLKATSSSSTKTSEKTTIMSESTKAAARGSSNDLTNKILVIGSANQDLISYSDIQPQLGETVMGKNFMTACGGKGGNQAVASALLGLTPVSIVCRVGNDIFGNNLLTNFKRVGVEYDEETTILHDKKDVSSAVASIVVDTKTGDNKIIVSPGANYHLTKQDVRDAILKQRPSMIVVQLEILPEVALEALKVGKEIGSTTIFNTAPAPEGYNIDEFYPYTDILIPNETELEKIYKSSASGGEESDVDEETMAKALLERGVNQAVIVTLGARGAMVVEKTGDGDTTTTTTLVEAPMELPARNQPVVNTVGAGDSFCGALASYYSTGKLSLPQAGIYACGVASMSVRKDGVQESYTSYDELPDCLKVDDILGEGGNKRAKKSKPLITFVTGNKKKLEEVQQILASGIDGDGLPFELTNRKIDLPELQGDPLEIAKEKCRIAAKEVNGPVLTEDTSLCFNALHGMPGPYIKWFLEKCGHDGLNKMLDGFDNRTGYAQTVVAYATGPDDDDIQVFEGRTDGKIVLPRGSLDFGWDPIFEPNEGEGKTYAEMSKSFKNSISHRGRSFAKVQAYLMEKFS